MNTPPPSKDSIVGSIPDNEGAFFGDDDAPFYTPEGDLAGLSLPAPGASAD